MAEQKVQGLTPNEPHPEDWVEMTHPQLEKGQRCSPRAVKHWESRGWRVAGAVEAPVTPAKTKAAQQGDASDTEG